MSTRKEKVMAETNRHFAVLPSFWRKRRGGVRASLARPIVSIDHCFRSAPIVVLARVLRIHNWPERTISEVFELSWMKAPLRQRDAGEKCSFG
jgi:hypothetical protein